MVQQKGFCAWFTGLSGSGKSTVADIVADKLVKRGLRIERLDGDIVRQSLTSDLGFSKEDRDKNIERITFVAKLLSRNEVGTLVSFISPYIAARDNARRECTNFIEIFVDCPVEECEKRDVKGLYRKARAGEIKEFTGISDPYEAPPNPEIVLKTAEETPEESANRVISYLETRGYIEPSCDEEGSSSGSGDSDYTEEDQEKIHDRLKALGYL